MSEFRKVVEVQPITKEYSDDYTGLLKFPLLEHTPCEDDLVGSLLDSNSFGKFKVLEYVGKKWTDTYNQKHYTIQFIDTGYVVENVRAEYVKKGNIKDRYKPNLYNVGYLGDYKIKNEVDKKLKNIWSKMIERCYDENHTQYKDYGGRGVFVDCAWHNLSTFIEDVKSLPNWNNKLEKWNDYSLDKDYYMSNCYSKDTCVWLTNKDNNMYSKSKPFKSIDEYGCEMIWISQTDCANYFNIKQSAVSAVLCKKNNKTRNGMKFVFIDGFKNYRYELD